MARRKKDSSIDFEAIGEAIAKLSDVKRRLMEASIRCGDEAYARRTLESARTYARMIREGLEAQLRDGELQDLTPAMAQQAIYGCQILEDILRADAERRH